ncbi:MAG TPA: glycosyltransferase family 4 protein [Terriglobales bacterium]|nr:glycosyltransferase family 4 protein [Terriglobales bacterium]
MKILLVHNTYQQPGGEDVVCDQERQLLQAAGHSVHVYRRSNFEADAYTGLHTIELARNTIWSPQSRRDLSALLRREKPDVVHVHNTFLMISPSIYSACAETGIPVVQTLHNFRLLCPDGIFFRDGHICEECMESSLARSVLHACYHGSRSATAVVAAMLAFHRNRGTWDREISCFIALTEFARAKFIAGGLPADKIAVKPNFVAPDPGYGTGTRDYALFMGRLAPAERVRTLLRAWRELSVSIPLVIAGGGPNQAELEAEAGRLGLTQVQFRGHLPREQSIAALKAARFLVLPSEWYEGFPLTLAEAFACGTPVICSRLGAMQEIVRDRETGLHFTPGDAVNLRAKVDWATLHPGEMRQMGEAARKEYETRYTAEANYPILMSIYNRVINPSSR